jgi:hypothetical protein
MTFSKDFDPTKTDANGRPLGACEINNIVTHRGKLYAAASALPADRDRSKLGPKILVKTERNGPWAVDTFFGSTWSRAGMIKSVEFTTDYEGRKLDPPVPVLIAGLGAWQFQTFSDVRIASRNDATGRWTVSLLSHDPWFPDSTNDDNETRTIFDHVAFGLKVRGLPEPEQRDRARRALAMVELSTGAFWVQAGGEVPDDGLLHSVVHPAQFGAGGAGVEQDPAGARILVPRLARGTDVHQRAHGGVEPDQGIAVVLDGSPVKERQRDVGMAAEDPGLGGASEGHRKARSIRSWAPARRCTRRMAAGGTLKATPATVTGSAGASDATGGSGQRGQSA